MNEIWKDISGYEGYYQVSSTGRVRSLDRIAVVSYGNRKSSNTRYKGKILCQSETNGYAQVVLHKNSIGETRRVNRLVAEAFIPNPQNLPIVNHKDENPKNNNIDNLEWCDHKYNANYGNCSKKRSISHINKMYNRKPVVCINTNEYFESSCDAERKTGIKSRSIRTACCNPNKTSGGYKWRYATEDEIVSQRAFEKFKGLLEEGVEK